MLAYYVLIYIFWVNLSSIGSPRVMTGHLAMAQSYNTPKSNCNPKVMTVAALLRWFSLMTSCRNVSAFHCHNEGGKRDTPGFSGFSCCNFPKPHWPEWKSSCSQGKQWLHFYKEPSCFPSLHGESGFKGLLLHKELFWSRGHTLQEEDSYTGEMEWTFCWYSLCSVSKILNQGLCMLLSAAQL